MEVMPNLLARRNFKLPVTRRMIEPGYRDAPHPSEPMAIMFVKVRGNSSSAPPVLSALSKFVSCSACLAELLQVATV